MDVFVKDSKGWQWGTIDDEVFAICEKNELHKICIMAKAEDLVASTQEIEKQDFSSYLEDGWIDIKTQEDFEFLSNEEDDRLSRTFRFRNRESEVWIISKFVRAIGQFQIDKLMNYIFECEDRTFSQMQAYVVPDCGTGYRLVDRRKELILPTDEFCTRNKEHDWIKIHKISDRTYSEPGLFFRRKITDDIKHQQERVVAGKSILESCFESRPEILWRDAEYDDVDRGLLARFANGLGRDWRYSELKRCLIAPGANVYPWYDLTGQGYPICQVYDPPVGKIQPFTYQDAEDLISRLFCVKCFHDGEQYEQLHRISGVSSPVGDRPETLINGFSATYLLQWGRFVSCDAKGHYFMGTLTK